MTSIDVRIPVHSTFVSFPDIPAGTTSTIRRSWRHLGARGWRKSWSVGRRSCSISMGRSSTACINTCSRGRTLWMQTGIELAVWRIHRKIGMSGGLFANALLRETGRAVTPEEADRLRALHGEAYASRADRVRPLPGARELLEHLTRLDVPWAIATSGYIESAGPTMEGLGIPATTPVITRDQVVHAKPDPDLFLAAAAALDVDIAHTVVVGDSVWICSRLDARERWASGCCPVDTAKRSSSAPVRIASTKSRRTCSATSTRSAFDDRGSRRPPAHRGAAAGRPDTRRARVRSGRIAGHVRVALDRGGRRIDSCRAISTSWASTAAIP